jgi:thiamine biosynthesis lipoprotein
VKASLAATLLLVASAHAAPITEVHYVMGTYLRITAEGEAARSAMRGCFTAARKLEGVFSRFDAASELVRLNASAGTATPVGDDMRRLLARAATLSTATAGAFDVTVGALSELWRRGAPRADEVEAARAHVGRGRAILRGGTLSLAPATSLDFDGIAKGYAVDVFVGLLRAGGVSTALVSLGESSLAALGAPAGETHWSVALRGVDPELAVGTLRLRDQAVSVSATYGDRGRMGRAYGHIIDPRSGRPLTEDAVAVIVVRSATDAEAYSKALLIWGSAGVGRIERLGAAALYQGPKGTAVGQEAAEARLYEPFASPARIAQLAPELR